MEKLTPIELPYKKLKDISQKQIDEHFEILYKGYIKKVNEIRTKLERGFQGLPNATYDVYRELKLEESFAYDGVKLHESYFLSLGGDGVVSEKVRKIFTKHFGSFENWLEEFHGLGLASRGWAVLYYDLDKNRLFNGLSDFHSHGGIWNAKPVLALDVYEHAYFMDYGTNKKKYIEAYFNNLNWAYISDEIKNIKKWP